MIIFDKHSLKDPNWGKGLIMPILGCTILMMGDTKTRMGINKVISFEEVVKEKGQKEPIFSLGL